MASEEGGRGRLAEKLGPGEAGPSTQRVSLDLPSRFRQMEKGSDDVARMGGRDAGAYMHQSIFNMIPAFAGRGHSNLQSRFDDDPSESDEDRVDGPPQRAQGVDGLQEGRSRKGTGKHSLFKSIAQIKRPRPKRFEEDVPLDRMSASQILPPRQEWPSTQEVAEESEDAGDGPSSQAPVLSRMLTAEVEMEASQATESPETKEEALADDAQARRPVSLSERLQQIFKFAEPEDVIAEHPCWLLQTVLLQGYMYITQRHVCFYAYLPKKDTEINKSGYLAKRQRTRPKVMYKRFFFELRGDYLTYYTDSSKRIFPHGHIDLRYAISASVDSAGESGKEATDFKVNTNNRDYHFRADSAESAKAWVKQLQRVILRLSNEGDSVKICVPIENIINVETNQTLDFADTVKIQVIDNQETFAVDDYLFSFFSQGDEAYRVLKLMADENSHHAKPDGAVPAEPAARLPGAPGSSTTQVMERGRTSRSPFDPPKMGDYQAVRTTVAPAHSPPGRLTTESTRAKSPAVERRRSFDAPGQGAERNPSPSSHRSADSQRSGLELVNPQSPLSSRPQDSSDSVSHSLAQGTESSAAIQSLDATDASASKLLERSTLFHTPVVHRMSRSESTSSVQYNRRGSEDTARSLEPQRGTQSNQRPESRPHHSNATSPSMPLTPGEGYAERPGYTSRPSYPNQSYALRDLVRAGANPLQAATDVTQYLTKRSKDMSSLLASESMGYYEKVSGMWAGKRKHYDNTPGISVDDEVQEDDDDERAVSASARFRSYFALPEHEKLKAIYFASIQRVLPLYGKIYIGNNSFCFRSLLPGTRFKVVLPFERIENINKERGYRPGHPGVVVVIRGFEELFFEFSRKDDRDDCVVTLLQSLERTRYMRGTADTAHREQEAATTAKLENELLQEARQERLADDDQRLRSQVAVHDTDPGVSPVFDDPRVSMLNFKPPQSLRITCLTIGSRGDVQPYIALCKGLKAEGHRPCIATHAEFGEWIMSHDIDFRPVAGDPAELMRICVENGMFTVNFLREATSKFRGWLDGLLVSAWEACQGTDLLIESPSAMAGIHIAEALEIPYIRAFSMPWTRTRAYPHAFGVPERRMGGYYNYMTYVMFDRVFWKAIAGQVNSWRKKELGLGSTNYDMLQSNKVPFLYFYSPSVVPPPADYSEWIRITGYWFLDVDHDFQPPKDIEAFVAKARQDKKKIVYIGFGSIVVEDPAALTRTVVDSVLKADVRCILSKGWSDRLGNQDIAKPEMPLPPEILQIKGAPHDWLFQQIDAAVHHGGSGTTGASLRAGIPTIIKPFFGDQFFFGSRVEALGVGICLYKINVKVLAKALWEATHSERLKVKARLLGKQIQKEDGIYTAIQTIYRDLDYARTLSKRRNKRNSESAADLEEETWTFVGDESDLLQAVEGTAATSKRSFEGSQH